MTIGNLEDLFECEFTEYGDGGYPGLRRYQASYSSDHWVDVLIDPSHEQMVSVMFSWSNQPDSVCQFVLDAARSNIGTPPRKIAVPGFLNTYIYEWTLGDSSSQRIGSIPDYPTGCMLEVELRCPRFSDRYEQSGNTTEDEVHRVEPSYSPSDTPGFRIRDDQDWLRPESSTGWRLELETARTFEQRKFDPPVGHESYLCDMDRISVGRVFSVVFDSSDLYTRAELGRGIIPLYADYNNLKCYRARDSRRTIYLFIDESSGQAQCIVSKWTWMSSEFCDAMVDAMVKKVGESPNVIPDPIRIDDTHFIWNMEDGTTVWITTSGQLLPGYEEPIIWEVTKVHKCPGFEFYCPSGE
ncbi:MAG: hypothetical protein ABIK83_06735 [Candidatus Zixiibacteriota bacterium]